MVFNQWNEYMTRNSSSNCRFLYIFKNKTSIEKKIETFPFIGYVKNNFDFIISFEFDSKLQSSSKKIELIRFIRY
jgi:hypothetical protein